MPSRGVCEFRESSSRHLLRASKSRVASVWGRACVFGGFFVSRVVLGVGVSGG